MNYAMNFFPLREVKRFDLVRMPRRVSWYLRPVAWLLSFPSVWRHRTKIFTVDMEGVKPPYLLLCNHNAFYDFMVATVATFPHQAFYVVAVDGFIGREWLMRRIGCIGKRKFTNDIALIRHLKTVVERGKIAAVYPEARYSLCGTNAVLPPSLGKLVKHLNVPVVTLITYGHHINAPFWNNKTRGVRTKATMKRIITGEEASRMPVEQINQVISQAFEYDDFAWQRENKIPVTYKERARGLHKVLYQCSGCRTEYKMDSGGTEIWCNHCGRRWIMSAYGELKAQEGETHFVHIPDWYEWEREQVRREVEEGRYCFKGNAYVRMLPNSKGFVDFGQAVLIHDMEGFKLEGTHDGAKYTLNIPAQSVYSCHIEYNYGKYKRDCVDLNTLNDSYWVFPEGDDFSVTKISLATEELFNYKKL
ncbi:MAG: 1-acyl-sn-glycerol-3-phosphate acyltransferase [Bacteroidales bacterium]|jgi:LSD1 subclass zinc finger protein|nr:1-acyl-sn-glycerol-3-phosphate acyltransferase [Bacteroidales bacterium]